MYTAAVPKTVHVFQKGSECKPMLTKLKSQFEELKSKVVFLDWVKKYLEVTTQNSPDSHLLLSIRCQFE